MDRARWPEVAPDVLRDIAGRLHDAADFVRFHSACKPWRDSGEALPPLFRTMNSTAQFLPWLLAPADKDLTTPLKLRCIFSKSSYRAPRQPAAHGRNWISSADGSAVRCMAVEHLRPSLHDPISGEEAIHLPRFRWDEGDPHGVVYGDGTVLLYSVVHENGTARFRAALLGPGKANWTLVKRTLENPGHVEEACVAYHRGKILVTVDANLWHVITPDSRRSDVLIPRPHSPTSYWHHNSYVLESRGELLWMLPHVRSSHRNYGDRPVQGISLLVLVLEVETTSSTDKVRWVIKDRRSLADRVFFLGWPNSFAIDASQLGGHGGCAFFVYTNAKALPGERLGVFRYNLLDYEIDFVERLAPGWGDHKCTWLLPHPAIAQVQEITKRLLMAKEVRQQETVTSVTSIIRMVKHYEPSITVLVRDLPLTVESSQLQLLFSKHGKVSHARVIYYQKTNTWQGILTMTTVHAHHDEALDALNGLILDGCRLKVSLVKEENRRRRHGRLPSE